MCSGDNMQVKVYERIELKLKENTSSVYLMAKKGEKNALEPFLYQPVEFVYNDEGIEQMRHSAEPYDMVRFTLKEEGEYTVEICYTSGETEAVNITAQGFANDGYVTVSQKDSRYFSYTNEKGYFPIGINVCFPRKIPVSDNSEFGVKDEFCFMGLRQYERWFKKLSQNGVNLVRIWLGHPYFSPSTFDAEVFDYAQFSKIDALIILAKKYGLKLKLTFEQFRYTDYGGKGSQPTLSYAFNNPIKLNGEICPCIEEWTTKDKWKNAWLNKVHEFAKRYAGDTEIFAFELWNEMNCLPNTNEWNREMLPRVKEYFPDNMVINSLGSMDCDQAVNAYNSFPWELTAFKQVHRYLDQGAKLSDTARNPIEMTVEGIKYLKKDDMPLILAETGGVNNCHSAEFKYYSVDDRGMLLVDCVYTAVFCGMASCGNIWHWDERYIEAKNLYKYFVPISKLAEGIDFASEEFEPIDLSDDSVYLLILKGKTLSIGFIRNKADCWQNVLRDMNETKTTVNKTIEFNADSIEQIKIWDNDTTKITTDNGKLIFDNILYGTIFKIK